MKIKSAQSEVSAWVYWTWICALGINVHNNQNCTGIEPALLSLAGGTEEECGNHSATKTHLYSKQREIYRQTIWLWCHTYVIHEWVVNGRVLIAYLQLKFDEIQNDYLT